MRFKSSKGNFTHIYTYIKLEQNFYLVKKNKKKKERRIIENIKHRNPTWLLVHSLFIIIIFFFLGQKSTKNLPLPPPPPHQGTATPSGVPNFPKPYGLGALLQSTEYSQHINGHYSTICTLSVHNSKQLTYTMMYACMYVVCYFMYASVYQK